MSYPLPSRLKPLADLLDMLAEAAHATAIESHRRYRRAQRRGIGVTLSPGPDTPLWNELVRASQPYLKAYGEKAKLARILGISRQRLHLLLVARTACPDAERTLGLLAWVVARAQGQHPA